MKIKNIAIVGLGALGIMYANHFSKKIGKENVRIVVNETRKKKYEEEGIFANGQKCSFYYVEENEKTEPADLILFCVKGTSLQSGLETARNQIGPKTIIISVLNGISSEEVLADAFGNENIIHCVSQGMDAVRVDNQLNYTRMGELRIGIDQLSKQEKLEAVSTFFDQTEFPYTIEQDIQHRIWKKFMMNVGINQVLMVTEGSYGDVQKEGSSRELMIQAMQEVMPIAQAEGINLIEQDLQDNLELLATLSPENMPSMRQDGIAKRYSEVELFAGTVLAKAKIHKTEAPTNQFLYQKIKEIEAAYS